VQHEVDQQAGKHSVGVEAQQGGAADGCQGGRRVIPALHSMEGSLVLGHVTPDVLQAPPVGASPRHGEAPSASHTALLAAVTALDPEASTDLIVSGRGLLPHIHAGCRPQRSTANHQIAVAMIIGYKLDKQSSLVHCIGRNTGQLWDLS